MVADRSSGRDDTDGLENLSSVDHTGGRKCRRDNRNGAGYCRQSAAMRCLAPHTLSSTLASCGVITRFRSISLSSTTSTVVDLPSARYESSLANTSAEI